MERNSNKTDELLDLIRKELTAIIAKEESDAPSRKLSYEEKRKPKPLPTLEPTNVTAAAKKTSTIKNSSSKPSPSVETSKITETKSSSLTDTIKVDGNESIRTAYKAHSYRQNSGKSITMNPSNKPLSSGQAKQDTQLMKTGSAYSLPKASSIETLSEDVGLIRAQTDKNIRKDMEKMQKDLEQSYELFQKIGSKLESISFAGLKGRIHDLNLNDMSNEMGKVTTIELQKMFENRFIENRLDSLTTDVSKVFNRHPGEFGGIPELSSFFQTCTQLEHGLKTLEKQRKRNNELEKRMCWATEIAHDRMEGIRSALGPKPESNF